MYLNTYRTKKGSLNHASIEIIFTIFDLSLANAIKFLIVGCYLIQNKNYLRIIFKDKKSILKIIK